MKLETIINQPVIEAESFDLRPLRASDAGLITLYAGDARVANFTTDIPHPLPRARSRRLSRAQVPMTGLRMSGRWMPPNPAEPS